MTEIDKLIRWARRYVADLEQWIDMNPFSDTAFYAGQRDGLKAILDRIEQCPECGGSGYVSDGRGSGEPCGCNAEWRFNDTRRE